jgi:hypothetical protein
MIQMGVCVIIVFLSTYWIDFFYRLTSAYNLDNAKINLKSISAFTLFSRLFCTIHLYIQFFSLLIRVYTNP